MESFRESSFRLLKAQLKHTKESDFLSSTSYNKKLKRSGWDVLLWAGLLEIFVNVKPKDFDIVTNASPNEIKDLFRRSRIIGRRFRIVHVYIGNETIEVSTFRKPMYQIRRILWTHLER